jgi:hypothetical protein
MSEDKIINAIAELSKKQDAKMTNISKQIEALNSKLDNINKNMETRINEVKNYVDVSWICFKKSHELLLTGIPAVKDEKTLIQKFTLIAATLGYSDNNIPETQIYRMAGDTSKPVVIRFPTIYHKDIFLRKYYSNYKLLTLQRLGFSDDGKVYLQPNLSKTNYEILKLALKYKKLGVIQSVRTLDYINIAIQLPSGKIRHIHGITELKTLVTSTSGSQSTSHSHKS